MGDRGLREGGARGAAAPAKGEHMRLLIAHGDRVSRCALCTAAAALPELGLETVESGEGVGAVRLLLGDDAPGLAVVDWDLPGVGGPELCRQVKTRRRSGPPYIILLAPSQGQVGEAFAAGADDCVPAGAGEHELQARIMAARRLGGL
jgi:DNA-binding response OmpR family regulator